MAGVYHPTTQGNQGQVEGTWLSLERRQEMLATPVWCSSGTFRSRSQGRISRGARDGYGVERNTSKAQRDHLERVQGDCRSEEHTSELQSLRHLVCRLLL